ncbi:MAG TPA: hypothetical protein VHH15_05850 [Actinophytocola sp.]|nr:hypothetical protein [Actinophytocola sp.]
MIVSVADGQDMSTVVTELRRAGLTVTEVMAGAGVVTGTVDGVAVATLSTVVGVVDVETQGGFQLPPPDAPVQ